MANVEKVSVALTQDMAVMVRQAVESGEYASSSEVIRDALRDWKAKRALAQYQIDELRRLVAEGIASGSTVWGGVDATLAEVRKRSKAKADG
jgi:antitoxin ParD1/3/4